MIIYAFVGLVAWSVVYILARSVSQEPITFLINASVVLGALFVVSVVAYWFFAAIGYLIMRAALGTGV